MIKNKMLTSNLKNLTFQSGDFSKRDSFMKLCVFNQYFWILQLSSTVSH